MILHSVIPSEVVFENYEQVGKMEMRELQFGSITMLVEPTGAFEGRIIRMISPNPQDYLNPRFAPGQKIYFNPDVQRSQ